MNSIKTIWIELRNDKNANRKLNFESQIPLSSEIKFLRMDEDVWH